MGKVAPHLKKIIFFVFSFYFFLFFLLYFHSPKQHIKWGSGWGAARWSIGSLTSLFLWGFFWINSYYLFFDKMINISIYFGLILLLLIIYTSESSMDEEKKLFFNLSIKIRKVIKIFYLLIFIETVTLSIILIF